MAINYSNCLLFYTHSFSPEQSLINAGLSFMCVVFPQISEKTETDTLSILNS